MSANLPLNLVYLRPESAGVPVDYVRSVEKAGLMALPQQYLAMYVMSGSVGPTGPTGPTGPQGETPDVWDTIICAQSDQVTPLVVDLVNPTNTWRAPYALDMTNGYVRINVNTAPVGAALEIDIHMNGTSIFSTKPTIDAGEKTNVTAAVPAVLNIPANTIPDDAEFEVFVTQVGSSVAGTGLKVAISGIKIAI